MYDSKYFIRKNHLTVKIRIGIVCFSRRHVFNTYVYMKFLTKACENGFTGVLLAVELGSSVAELVLAWSDVVCWEVVLLSGSNCSRVRKKVVGKILKYYQEPEIFYNYKTLNFCWFFYSFVTRVKNSLL